MRILIVCGGGYVSGKEIVMLTLARGLREQGHEIRCAISSWSDGDFRARLQAAEIPATELAIGFISRQLNRRALTMTVIQALRLPGLWRDYRQLLGEYRPDVIVHTNHHHLALLSGRAGRVKQVYHLHDTVAPTRFHHALFRWLGGRMDRVITVSSYIRDEVVATGVDPGKVVAVLNGLDRPETPVAARNGQVPGRPAPAPVIGITAQMVRWKGHATLLDALGILRQAHVRFRCHIYGRGNPGYEEELRRQVDRLELAELVVWKGFVADQDEMYSAIDISVVPSLSNDPCPLAALEPAFRGIPVVASRRGGLPELVVHEQTGFLFDAADPAQLAHALRRLLADDDLRATMGARGRKRATESFTSEEMSRKFASVLEDVVAGRHAKK